MSGTEGRHLMHLFQQKAPQEQTYQQSNLVITDSLLFSLFHQHTKFTTVVIVVLQWNHFLPARGLATSSLRLSDFCIFKQLPHHYTLQNHVNHIFISTHTSLVFLITCSTLPSDSFNTS